MSADVPPYVTPEVLRWVADAIGPGGVAYVWDENPKSTRARLRALAESLPASAEPGGLTCRTPTNSETHDSTALSIATRSTPLYATHELRGCWPRWSGD